MSRQDRRRSSSSPPLTPGPDTDGGATAAPGDGGRGSGGGGGGGGAATAAVRRSEFQVVIMGGAGSSLSTLTNGYPKPLLPVLNRPVISYQLGLLERHGFSDAVLVVDGFDPEQADMLKAVVDFIDDFNGKSKLRVNVEIMQEALGTAEVLRKIAHLITGDFIVLPCDLVCECPLNAIADVFRATDSSCTLLLVEPSKVPAPSARGTRAAASPPKKMGKKQQIFGMAPLPSAAPGGRQRGPQKQHRVLFTSSREELESAEDEKAHRLVLPKAVLVHQPNIFVRSDLDSAHVYFFSHWVLRLLEAKQYLISIRADLVPFLMRAQYRSMEVLPADIHDTLQAKCSKNFLAMALDGKDEDGQGNNTSSDILRVTSLTISPDAFYCARARSFEAVLAINQRLLTHEPRPFTPWPKVSNFRVKRQGVQLDASIVGPNSHIAPGAKIKSCVIGSNVKIGSKVNLIRCVILDAAEVGDNCTVQDTFLGLRARVGDKSSVKECQLGADAEVPNGSTVKAQQIVREPTS